MKKIIPAVFLALLVLSASVPFAEGAGDGDRLLVDYGNGEYEWFPIDESGTYLEILTSCKNNVSYSGGLLTIDGMGPIIVEGNETVNVDWKIYSWNGNKWVYEGTDFSSVCNGSVAFGLFPYEEMVPAATPKEPTVWTQMGGSSNAGSVSSSYGPGKPALPVEWYNSYTTGYVDSGIIAAGDLLYHTTGGTYGAKGSDGDPWVYCLNRYTGAIVWKYHGTYGSGYEVTTPLVVSDFLIVTTTCGDLLVFDRFTGEVVNKTTIPIEPPLDDDGNVSWNGRTFVTGGTTPVYDSGCIYFGSADGKVYCYTLSPEGNLSEVWCYNPDDSTDSEGNYVGTKGCFYFHAPTITDVDGTRMLFIGNYEGYLHALDITTGEAVWVRSLVDLRDSNKSVPGTPGSVASVSIGDDGNMLLVTCTDGGLFSLYGFLIALDPETGDTLSFSDGSDWKIEGFFTSPTIDEDGFYSYVTPLANRKLTKTDGTDIDMKSSFYKLNWDGEVVWMSKEYQLIKSSLTLADGVLYAMDYSAGSFWPSGGGVTAISAEDGSELWRIRLSPYTDSSYSMVQPTVIDGKIYVGNDLGAVYCISTTAGPGTEEEWIESLHTQGFHHWSWGAISIVTLASLFFLIRFY